LHSPAKKGKVSGEEMREKPTDEELEQGIHDAGEKLQSDEELRESEERYRTILESIEEAYFEVDLRGNLTFFNDSLCVVLGYSRDEDVFADVS
jgi:PAS domain-containing protein